MSHRWAWPFLQSVDYVTLNLPTYTTIVRFPMDLSTIKNRVMAGYYEDDIDALLDDVALVWANAQTFNLPNHDVYIMAETLRKEFNKGMAKIDRTIVVRQRKRPAPGSATRYSQDTLDEEDEDDLDDEETDLDDDDDDDDPDVHMSSRNGTTKSRPRKRARTTSRRGSTKRSSKTSSRSTSQRSTPAPKPLSVRTQAPPARRQTNTLDHTPLTYREKTTLKADIFRLPPAHLQHVLQIIEEAGTDFGDADDEIEIDFDKMDIATLRRLQSYCRTLNHGGSASVVTPVGTAPTPVTPAAPRVFEDDEDSSSSDDSDVDFTPAPRRAPSRPSPGGRPPATSRIFAVCSWARPRSWRRSPRTVSSSAAPWARARRATGSRPMARSSASPAR